MTTHVLKNLLQKSDTGGPDKSVPGDSSSPYNRSQPKGPVCLFLIMIINKQPIPTMDLFFPLKEGQILRKEK